MIDKSLDKIKKKYKLESKIYDLTRWAFLFNRKDAVNKLELNKGDTVAEFGCGTGLNFKLLHKKVGNNGKIIGIDFSIEMLKEAKKKIIKNNWKNIKLIQGDVSSFSLDEKLDGILFSYSLSMIPRWKDAIKNAKKILKNKKKFVILDFSDFRDVGIIQKLIISYFKRWHVYINRGYMGEVKKYLINVSQHFYNFGYNMIITGTKK